MTVTAVEDRASVARVLDKLEQHGSRVERRGSAKAMAQCPVHEDDTPSLSITWRDGATLLHCHGGCETEDVLAAIGLGLGDLFDAPLPPRSPGTLPRRPRPARRPVPDPAAVAAAAGERARKKAAKQAALGKPIGHLRFVDEYLYPEEQGQRYGRKVRRQQQYEHGYRKTFSWYHAPGLCPETPCWLDDEHTRQHDGGGWGRGAPWSGRSGRLPVLYGLPAVIAAVEAGTEIWLPEGEKDVNALNQYFPAHQVDALATCEPNGVEDWDPSFNSYLAGARLVIVEDNDPPQENAVTGELKEPAGQQRTAKLLGQLRPVAQSIRVVRARTGKDSFDHLSAGHNLAEFMPVQVPDAPDPEAADTATADSRAGRRGLTLLPGGGLGGPGGGGPGGGEAEDNQPNRRVTYLARQGELVRKADLKDSTRYDVVLGCIARMTRIEQRVVSGEALPVTTGYLIEAEPPPAEPAQDGQDGGHGRDGDDPLQLRVSRKEWDSGEWLQELPWPGLTYESSRSGLAKVRDAIRMTSPHALVTAVHGAPGWVRQPDGSWLFIHAGGAIGADGPVAVDVDLPAKLAAFELPAPPETPEALRAAALHSVGLVRQLPPRVGAVLAGLAYRAAISRLPTPVTLIGPPASYKTSMAKVTLHHFAPELPFDASVLSLSERGATGNAAAKLMYLARDVLLLADDAAPDRSLKAAAERVASIIRLQYNGETRDRLDRDADLRNDIQPPRGSLIISAEVAPSAASARQRGLIVPFSPGEISRDARVSLWEPESRQGRALLMASFITWQAGRRTEVLDRLEELTAAYAADWTENGYDERTAEALANLSAGWRLMLDHLTEAGACTAEEAGQWWQEARDGLADAGRTQEDPDEPIDPAHRILARIRTGLVGRHGHLTTRAGDAPDTAEAPRYGWSVEQPPPRSSFDTSGGPAIVRPGGDMVGCFEDVDGERRLYLVPAQALMMLKRVSDRLGEPCEETVSSVGEWLRQADVGLKTCTEKKSGRLRRSVQHVMPGGKRDWVWDIPESAIFPDADTDGGSPGDTPGGGRGDGGPGQQPTGTNDTPPRDDDSASARPATPTAQEALMTTHAPPAAGATGGWPEGTFGAESWAGYQREHAAAQPPPDAGPPPDRPPPPARTPAPAPGRPTRRPAAAVAERWRAAAAVVHEDGIYLPGGEKLPLPGELASIGDLAGLPGRLGLGCGGGKAMPAAGQLWLTGQFLTRAGLPGALPADFDQSEELLKAASQHPFITGAAEGGWQISEAARTRLGHRLRIWSDANRAGAQIVFVPYITPPPPLLDDGPGPAALAERLELYARHVGVPYSRSAAYAGHDLLAQLDASRRITVTGPADPAADPFDHQRGRAVELGGASIVSFHREPTAAEAAHRFLHSFDVTGAWLAGAKGTELGIGNAVHQRSPRFDPKLPGYWRVRPPAWDLAAIPSPFARRRPQPEETIWLPTPLLALAADPDFFGVDIVPEEAWTWPEHTRYLDKWATQLNNARLDLAVLSDDGDADASAVLATVKDTYSGALTLFSSSQLNEDKDQNRARHRYFRPHWTAMVISTAAARLYRKILQVERLNPGLWPVAIDRDNLLYASDDPDPATACPVPLAVGNQLGQVKNKGSALMAGALEPLRRTRLDFDKLLVRRGRWDLVHGGPLDDADPGTRSTDA